jgi:uncharacterized membrane protein AbrB (regulator of aidB expression)
MVYKTAFINKNIKTPKYFLNTIILYKIVINMTENIEQRIKDTKMLFGVGTFGLVIGAAFFVLSIITQNTNITTLLTLSIMAMGIGVGTMLFAKHHIKWLTKQTKQTNASTSVYWAKI